MLISTTNSFANISAQGYPILALFVLIDRTTCQLTNNLVIASSGTHFFIFMLFFLNGLIFLKLTRITHFYVNFRKKGAQRINNKKTKNTNQKRL